MNYAETLGVKAKAVESAIATAAPQVKNNALAAIADACWQDRRKSSPPTPKTWRLPYRTT